MEQLTQIVFPQTHQQHHEERISFRCFMIERVVQVTYERDFSPSWLTQYPVYLPIEAYQRHLPDSELELSSCLISEDNVVFPYKEACNPFEKVMPDRYPGDVVTVMYSLTGVRQNHFEEDVFLGLYDSPESAESVIDFLKMAGIVHCIPAEH